MGISGQVEGLFPSDKKYSTTSAKSPKSCIRFFLPGGGWQLFTPVRCSANSPFSGGPYCLVAGIQPLFSRERESIPPDFPILSGKETEQRRK